jgi:hypothetical protein
MCNKLFAKSMSTSAMYLMIDLWRFRTGRGKESYFAALLDVNLILRQTSLDRSGLPSGPIKPSHLSVESAIKTVSLNDLAHLVVDKVRFSESMELYT